MTTIGQITGVEEKKYKPMEGNDVIMRTANAFGQKEVDGYNSCLRTEVEVDVEKITDILLIQTGIQPDSVRGKEHRGIFMSSANTIATAIEKGGVIRVVVVEK